MPLELPDALKAEVAEICGQLQDALKLAEAKSAALSRAEADNRVLLEKVAAYEAQIKQAAAAPKTPLLSEPVIEAIIGAVKKADYLQPGGDTKIAAVLRADPIGGLTALVTQLSGLLAPAPAAGEMIEKSASEREGATGEFKPWALTLAHGAA